jgi:hypothetical protein
VLVVVVVVVVVVAVVFRRRRRRRRWWRVAVAFCECSVRILATAARHGRKACARTLPRELTCGRGGRSTQTQAATAQSDVTTAIAWARLRTCSVERFTKKWIWCCILGAGALSNPSTPTRRQCRSSKVAQYSCNIPEERRSKTAQTTFFDAPVFYLNSTKLYRCFEGSQQGNRGNIAILHYCNIVG